MEKILCKICHQNSLKMIVDGGLQPICNRYLETQDKEEFKKQLILSQCQTCGTIQILDPFPIEEIVPKYNWIKYNEPEKHLDQLTKQICDITNINPCSKVIGLSYKDKPLVERLKSLCNAYQIHPPNDFNASGLNIEDLLASFSKDKVKKFIEKNGRADVVIARHILEHTSNPILFVECIKEMLHPSGYIVFEVPDCKRAIETNDYTMIWEEHVLYFTKKNLLLFFEKTSLQTESFETYPYALEDVLIGITKKSSDKKNTYISDNVTDELTYGKRYGEKFLHISQKIKQRFKQLRQQYGEVVLLGAGHMACSFINLMDISNEINCVIDDHPSKQGLLMPLSHLPIKSSDYLMEKNIRVCISAINPENETKLISKFNKYVEKGGKFYSIYPISSLWLFNS